MKKKMFHFFLYYLMLVVGVMFAVKRTNQFGAAPKCIDKVNSCYVLETHTKIAKKKLQVEHTKTYFKKNKK